MQDLGVFHSLGALLFARQRKGAGNYRERVLSATAV